MKAHVFLLGVLHFASVYFFVATHVLAQDSTYQYNVKFVCGSSGGRVVAPGLYHTAINILNPGRDTVKAQSIISIALPRTPGMVSRADTFQLGRHQSLEIDCPEIEERTRSQSSFRKGFVIIQSMAPLEIVAVYTVAGADRRVESIHTERVPATKPSRACPDLVIESIERPVADSNRTVIRVRVKNIGTAHTGIGTQTMLTDPSTIDPSTGERYKRVLPTPPLDRGGFAILTFTLPYNIFNPEATIRVDADYVNSLSECSETNNSRDFNYP